MISMPKRSQIMQDPEVKKAIEEAKRRLAVDKIQEARDVVSKYGSEYNHAKEVFFSVNGARRILKNAGESV